MAKYVDMGESIKTGIDVTDSIPKADYIRDRKKVVKAFNDMAEDKFYSLDQKTITAAITSLTELNKLVTESNIVYSENDEYSALMDTILEDMESLKSKKTAIDPQIIDRDVNSYNNLMELAKISYSNHELLNYCKAYNNEPTIITFAHFVEKATGRDIRRECYKWVGSTIKTISIEYDSSKLVRKEKNDEYYTLTLDNITERYKTSVKEENRNKIVKDNEALQAKLKSIGRLSSDYKMPEKPDEL